MSDKHTPFTDDGVTYCGWDGHEGCGELWPCSTVRATGRKFRAWDTCNGDPCTCPTPQPAAAENARRLAWFSTEELQAEIARRAEVSR